MNAKTSHGAGTQAGASAVLIQDGRRPVLASLRRYAQRCRTWITPLWLGFGLRLRRLVLDPMLHLRRPTRAVPAEKNNGQHKAALEEGPGNFEQRVQRRTQELANSLSLLSATLESTADGILAVNLAGGVVLHNRQFAAMWGIPAELLEARNRAKIAAFANAKTRDPEAGWQRIRELHAHPEMEAFDLLELKDGRVFERYMKPQRVEGRLIGCVLNFRDVTKRRQAEAELAYERDLLRTLLDNVPDAIYFKDLQSRFVRCSQALARLFQQPDAAALLGKTDADFFTPEHARPAFEDEQAILRTGQPMPGKVEKETHADGRITWVLTSKVPWREKADKIIGTFGISKDITAMKEAEAKLAAAHRELVEASRQAGMAEVATSVLHNVGNVLNSVNVSAGVISERLRGSRISGVGQAAELLRGHQPHLTAFLAESKHAEQLLSYLETLSAHLQAEQKEVLSELAELVKNVEHINEIVALQQSYAKVCGVVEIVSLPALVEDALRMHLGALERHEVRVVRQFEPVPEAAVDKHKVLQILVNLISNAKYALVAGEAAERLLTVRIARKDSAQVCLSVADNGVGIAAENLARIFSLGFTTRPNGHGFGLHSGALAAREMGGVLRAESAGPQRGATFTLELPLQPQGQGL